MNCFYARIEELGIEASTPSSLLENAKEIVAHHKKITVSFFVKLKKSNTDKLHREFTEIWAEKRRET